MALSLGQLVTGGAAFSRGQREAEQAERTARLNQLQIEEANRQNQLRREMLQAPIGEPMGGLRMGPALETVLPPMDGTLAPSRPRPTPPPAPAAAPTGFVDTEIKSEEEMLYERLKPRLSSWNLSRAQGIVGAIPEETQKTIALLKDPKNFSTEELIGVYQYASYFDDSNTASWLRDVLLNRGVPDAQLRSMAAQRKSAREEVMRIESAEAARKAEAQRLAELRGRKTEAGVPAAGLKAQDAISRVIQREGGYVNDPDDIGGETKFGISKAAYPKLDIANLTEAEAARIYKRDYWDRINADKLPANIREMAFDAAVNQGVAWTRKALQDSNNDPQTFLQLRAQRYQDIAAANPSQEKFLQGWLNRLGEFAGGVMEAVVPAAVAAPAAVAPTAEAPAAPAPTAGVRQAPAVPAVLSDTQNIPFEMQRSMQQREEAVRLARMYQRAGMGQEFMQARAKVMELDNNMYYMQGMQGIQEFSLTGDPRRLAAVWSQYYGAQIGVQPRADGRYNILVGDQVAREGLSPTEVTSMARLSFDTGYRQAQQQASAEMSTEAFKAQLEIQKDQAKQLTQMIREIKVAEAQGNISQKLEWFKANAGWDIKPSGGGDGTVIIRPPGGAPYLFNPTPRTIEIDGVKVQTNSAYPIAGLPSLGGQPR